MRALTILGLVGVIGGAALAPAAGAASGAHRAVAPPAFAVGASGQVLHVSAPARATLHHQFVIRLRLGRPAAIAAFETSVLASRTALEVTAGLPGNGKGQMIDPAFSRSATRVGFYGGTPAGTRSDVIDIIATPNRAGLIRIRLALPLGVDRRGAIAPLRLDRTEITVRVGTSRRVWQAGAAAPAVDLRTRAALHEDLTHDGAITRADLYQAVNAWDSSAADTFATGPDGGTGDVDGDGYTTVRDLQLLVRAAPEAPAVGRISAAAIAPTATWVVTTTSDAPDAAPGDGTCAIAGGGCSLRAAIDEANRRRGDDLITFNIPGGAPQTINVGSTLTQINSSTGALEIDGYSEPGAHANTDPVVSNALPGIVLNESSAGADEKVATLLVTSPGNVIRGLAFFNTGRAIHLLGPTAQGNQIIGDFFGMNAFGQFAQVTGYGAISVDGAAHNIIGTPALADRNVIAGFFYGIVHDSPGADDNLEQNNLIGLSPDGQSVNGTRCDSVDHNIGPKGNQLGGLGPHEHNVIVAAGCNGIEFSHGWNPALPARADTSLQYQVNGNAVIGNYLGYAPDGHFETKFMESPGSISELNGSGVNIIDVSNGNLVEGNWIAAKINGVQIFGFQTEGNVVRGNHIGISPTGAAGYIGFSGVSVRWHASNEQIVGNDIHNTGKFTGQAPPAGDPNVSGCIDNTDNRPQGCGAGIRVGEGDDTGVLISQNTFSAIGSNIGIDLQPLGIINTNDAGDADGGANAGLNYPVIGAGSTSSVSGTACAGCTVEVAKASGAAGAHGLAVLYLGSTVADAAGGWTYNLTAPLLAVGDRVTSIAIDAASNTSEESADVAVVQGPPIVVPPPPVDPVTPVTPVTPTSPVTPTTPATPGTSVAGGPGTTGTTPGTSGSAGGGTGAGGGAAAASAQTGRLVVFDGGSAAYRVSVDGSSRLARLATFRSGVITGLAPGAHTLLVTTLGTSKATHASRSVTVVAGRAVLALVGTHASGPALTSSLLPAPTSSSSAISVVNLTAGKLSLTVDGKGSARTVGTGGLTLAGLSPGAHVLGSSLLARATSSSKARPKLSSKLRVGAGSVGLVFVGSNGTHLRSTTLVLSAG